MTAPDTVVPGVVELGGVASGFPSGNGYDVSWTATDLHTGEVVYDEPNGYGNGDGVLFDIIQAGLFEADVNGSMATIEVGLSVTAQRGGVSVTDTASATLSWTMPSSPITGSLIASGPPTYQVVSYHNTVCAPVGTTVTFALSGTTERAFVQFADFASDYPQFIPVGPSNTVQLTTTTPCWAPVVARLDFGGQLTGTTDFTISW